MGVIRLLQWNNFMADSDQPMQTLPHNQNFDVKLKLDISNVPIATKSQLDITGTLIAKKLGTHERRVIGETQVIGKLANHIIVPRTLVQVIDFDAVLLPIRLVSNSFQIRVRSGGRLFNSHAKI